MRFYLSILLVLMSVTLISGCGSFENILPDREKEYQYSSEIPPLEVPPDLTTASIEKSPIRSISGARAEKVPATVPTTNVQAPGGREGLPEPRKEASAPDVNRSPEGAYVTVEEEFPIAWRMVGRALSRLEIEVEDLNRSEGLYYIIFEDRRNRGQDEGFFSSLAFWSDSNTIDEQQFQVQVTDKSEKTEIRILNEEGVGLSEGTGLDILQMIQKKIDDQIAGK